MLQSPSWSSIEVFHSFLKVFCYCLMVLLLPVELSPFSFSILFQIRASTQYSLWIFSSSFPLMRVSIGHAWYIKKRLLLFLLMYMWKSHKILQSSDYKTFSGWCIYQFYALLNAHFWNSVQWSILATSEINLASRRTKKGT